MSKGELKIRILLVLRKEPPRTQEHRQHDQPCTNIRKGLVDLLALETPVLRAYLIVANAFQSCYTLLPREHSGVHGGIGHPDQNCDAHHNSECTEEKVKDAVWLEGRIGIEGNALLVDVLKVSSSPESRPELYSRRLRNPRIQKSTHSARMFSFRGNFNVIYHTDHHIEPRYSPCLRAKR